MRGSEENDGGGGGGGGGGILDARLFRFAMFRRPDISEDLR